MRKQQNQQFMLPKVRHLLACTVALFIVLGSHNSASCHDDKQGENEFWPSHIQNRSENQGSSQNLSTGKAPLKEAYPKPEEPTSHSLSIRVKDLEIKRLQEVLNRQANEQQLTRQHYEHTINVKNGLITGLEEELEEWEDEVDSLSSEITRLSTEMESAQANLLGQNASLQEKDGQIRGLVAELKESKDKITSLTRELTERNANLSEKGSQIEGIQQELSYKTRQLTTCWGRIVTKDEVINDLKVEKALLTERTNKLINDRDSLMRQIYDTRYELAKINATFLKNDDGDTELILAVSRGDELAVKDLVRRGACVNSRNNAKWNPLLLASKLGDKDLALRIIKILINHGADVYPKDHDKDTFLHNFLSRAVASIQFHDITTFLLSKRELELFNVPGGVGRTPLMSALWTMNEDVQSTTLSLLLRNSVDFGKVDYSGNNLLTFAIFGKRSTTLLSKLIELGVDLKGVNNNGAGLLHIAAGYGNEEALKFFLEKGLNVSALDSYGNTPLHQAAQYRDGFLSDVVQLLIENGANANVRNGVGETALDALKMNVNDVIDMKKVVELLSN